MPGTYCEIDLDKEKRDAFVYAIKNHYWYQMYIDDLPIWGKYSVSHSKFGGYLHNKQDAESINVFSLFSTELF